MKLFTKRTRTPYKLLNRQTTKFEKMIADCTEKKMVAFDNTPVKTMRYANTTVKNMCFIKNLKSLDHEPKSTGVQVSILGCSPSTIPV